MDTFELFSMEHFLNLGGYLVTTLLLALLSAFCYKKTTLARVSALLIAGVKIAETVYRYVYFKEPLVEMLPLHLCNLTFITAVLTMAFKSYFFFELTYFWTIGAFFALLTPEVKLSFPNFWNISFFSTHYYLFYTVIFCISFWKFKPTKKSLLKAIIYLNIIFAFVFILNTNLGTNYMYINYKPDFNSPIDYLGPWPYYILSFEGIGIALFMLAYLPFRKKKPHFSTRF